MNKLDKILNNITMYRLLLHVLGILSSLSIIFAFMGRLSSTPTELVLSIGLIVLPAYAVDRGFGRLYKVPTNMESSLITALILFLIMQPAHSIASGLALMAAGAISSASKFIVSYNGRHVFNPAAFAAAVLSLTGLQATTWWVGNSLFWPFSLVLGIIVVRKIRRAPLVLLFAAASILVQLLVVLHAHQPVFLNMKQALVASPLIFLATIMLTEPATMPTRRNQRYIFALLIAVLYVVAPRLGPLVIYPEVALLIGNIFAFLVSPKFKIRMQLTEIQQVSDRVYNYVFRPDRPFKFLPGQYMEWTLAGVPYDSRGNRRTFTIASSPTETEVHLGLKYYEPASMYKAAFQQLQPGDVVYASQLAGNFTLPAERTQKLAFIAGGIGITPFRSMIQYLTDTHAAADIVVLYIVSDPHDFAYLKQLREARAAGIRTVLIVTDTTYTSPDVLTARVSAGLITKLIPDYAQRSFYISGPNTLVDASKDYLRQIGVKNRRIKTDHFSGY